MTPRTASTLGVMLLAALLLMGCSGPEARVARYMERSQGYLDEQNYDKARIEVSNALQINPNNAAARVIAGQIAEKQGKPRDAVGNYLAAVEADPENVDARAALGRLYLLAGMRDKVKETIEPALKKAPGHPQLLTVRGGLRAMEGDLAGAMTDAEAAVKAAPGDEVAIALLASQYSRTNRPEDAIATVEAGLKYLPKSVDLRIILGELQLRAGRPAEAEKQLKHIADSNRSSLDHWQNLARFELLQKNPSAAEQALRDAVKYNPDSGAAKNALVSLVASQKGMDAAQAQMLEFVKAEPKNAELKVSLGQFYEASRKPELAEKTYREVIAAEGVKTQGLEARNRLAALLMQRPDEAAAEKLIGEVLTETPRNNDALVLRAGIELSRNNTASAITDLRAVLRDQPTSQPLMRALARAHLQARDATLAEEVFRNAVTVDPSDIQTRFELASLLAQTGRAKDSMPILVQLSKDAADNVAVREALFRVQSSQQDWEGAEQSAEAIKRLRPDLTAGYLLMGSLREREKKDAEAIAEYESAIATATDSTAVLPSAVRVDLRQNQPQRAMARLAAAQSKSPDTPLLHELVGEVRMFQRDYPAAITSFERAIASNPKWFLPYRGKALAQDALKQPELALAALKNGYAASGAVELGQDLAVRLERSGKHDEAINTYQELLKRAPDSLPVANNLAMMLLDRRTDATSLGQAEKLGEILAASTEAPYLDTRGWIKFRRGQIQEALPLLKQASEKAPNSREILFHLGMAQYRSGDSKNARQNLEAALAANQNFAGVDEARAALVALRAAG